MRYARPVAAAAAVSSMLVLPGCLISGSSDTKMSGAYVGPSTFGEIEPGVTTVDWVCAVMGEPTSKATLDDGSQIWKWAYTRKHSSAGGVFLLVGGSSKSEEQGATFVQMKDGVVVKAWRD
jgi:hypothetical protein